MNAEAWLTILAIVVGPILALSIQRIVDLRRERRGRKLWLFRELMATRALRLSQRHVEALNLIDVEFDPKRSADKSVLDAWKLYLDSLNTKPSEQQEQIVFQKRDDLFIDLVYEIGKYLNFSFDKVAIRRNSYIPIAHGNLEEDWDKIRKGLVELLTGQRAVSTFTWLMPAPEEKKADASGPPEQKQPL